MPGFGNIGLALSGVGQAQPQLQAMQDLQRKRAQEAALAQALQQGGQPPAGLPQQMPPMAGGINSPQGGPVPLTRPNGAPAGPPAPGGAPSAAGAPPMPTQAPPVQQPPQSFAGGMPNLETMIQALSKSGLPPDQQFEALQNYGAFASPFEKMQQQLTMAQQKMEFQSSMLDERLKEMDRIANARNATSTANTNARVGATERGQDVRADTGAQTRDVNVVSKELSDQRALLTGMLNSNPKAIDSVEYKQEKQVFDNLRTELEGLKKGAGKSTAPAASTTIAPAKSPAAAAAPQGVPLPPEMKDKPDGSTVPDDTGKMWIKKGDQLVPQG